MSIDRYNDLIVDTNKLTGKESQFQADIKGKSKYIEDVDVLLTDYGDQAYLYNDGKVDIIKNGYITKRKFPSKKDANFYLMKTGWTYPKNRSVI